jgi:hypothetical protein
MEQIGSCILHKIQQIRTQDQGVPLSLLLGLVLGKGVRR